MLTSSARHTLIVRSWELLYRRPVPPHFTHVTALEWPVSVNRVCPSTTSHILMSPSLEPLAIRLHSGLLQRKTFIQTQQIHIWYHHKSQYVACFHCYDKLDISTFIRFVFVCIKIFQIYQISKSNVLTLWTKLQWLLYVPRALIYDILHFAPSIFTRFPLFSQQTTIISLNSINWSVSLMQTWCIYCQIHHEVLNIIYITSSLEIQTGLKQLPTARQ